jgi:hypothetical protein
MRMVGRRAGAFLYGLLRELGRAFEQTIQPAIPVPFRFWKISITPA